MYRLSGVSPLVPLYRLSGVSPSVPLYRLSGVSPSVPLYRLSGVSRQSPCIDSLAFLRQSPCIDSLAFLRQSPCIDSLALKALTRTASGKESSRNTENEVTKKAWHKRLQQLIHFTGTMPDRILYQRVYTRRLTEKRQRAYTRRLTEKCQRAYTRGLTEKRQRVYTRGLTEKRQRVYTRGLTEKRRGELLSPGDAHTLQASLSRTFLQTLSEPKGHSLSPRSCPPTLSAPFERFGY